jgi:hypothetical protein
LAVAYANFMKSAAQRLGPTLIITRPKQRLIKPIPLCRVG